MSDERPDAEREQPPTTLAGAAHGRGQAAGELEPGGLTYRETRPGEWTPERAQYELKAETAAHKQQLDAARTRHELQEAAKDNNLRRQREQVGFYVIVGVAVVMLGVGFLVGVWSENADTRRWAQGFVTLILGGLVGGLAGYFTGKVGNR